MTDRPFPLSGSTLIVGPSGAGKTRLTARALETWLGSEGSAGVVVLEFAPEVERNGRVLGRPLDDYIGIPDGVWSGVLDAHAPRSASETDEEAIELAGDNARRANRIFDAAPADPRAVFVDDATIPFQRGFADPDRLTSYCERAECTVVNAFAGNELGVDDPVSRWERNALAVLREWADRVVELG